MRAARTPEQTEARAAMAPASTRGTQARPAPTMRKLARQAPHRKPAAAQTAFVAAAAEAPAQQAPVKVKKSRRKLRRASALVAAALAFTAIDVSGVVDKPFQHASTEIGDALTNVGLKAYEQIAAFNFENETDRQTILQQFTKIYEDAALWDKHGTVASRALRAFPEDVFGLAAITMTDLKDEAAGERLLVIAKDLGSTDAAQRLDEIAQERARVAEAAAAEARRLALTDGQRSIVTQGVTAARANEGFAVAHKTVIDDAEKGDGSAITHLGFFLWQKLQMTDLAQSLLNVGIEKGDSDARPKLDEIKAELERQRLAELERQRLEQLEREKQARIAQERREAQKRIDRVKRAGYVADCTVTPQNEATCIEVSQHINPGQKIIVRYGRMRFEADYLSERGLTRYFADQVIRARPWQTEVAATPARRPARLTQQP